MKCSRCTDESVEGSRYCLVCRRAYDRERYHKRRADKITSLGGVCTNCGGSENLEFDHIDPDDKAFNVSKNWTKPVEALNVEYSKCQLLCKSCHKLKTSGERSVEHGGGLTGKKNCACSLCRPLKSAYMQARRK